MVQAGYLAQARPSGTRLIALSNVGVAALAQAQETLAVTVSDAFTDDEWPATASNRVTTYQLNVVTTLPGYPEKQFTARQRFEVFVGLYADLVQLGKTCGARLPECHVKTSFFDSTRVHRQR